MTRISNARYGLVIGERTKHRLLYQGMADFHEPAGDGLEYNETAVCPHGHTSSAAAVKCGRKAAEAEIERRTAARRKEGPA